MKVDKVDTIKKEGIKKAFLKSLADEKICGSVYFACRAIGYSRSWVYKLRSEDSAFSQEWDEVAFLARESLADLAESKLHELVRNGNVTAIIFTLKKLRPGKWGDRQSIKPPIEETHEMSDDFYQKVYLPYRSALKT